LLETLFDLIFVYNTEVYLGHSKFVAVLNCAPHLTADVEFEFFLRAFQNQQPIEVRGQTHTPAALLPETVAQAAPDKDVLRTAAPILTI